MSEHEALPLMEDGSAVFSMARRKKHTRDPIVVVLTVWTLALMVVSGIYTHKAYRDVTRPEIRYSPVERAARFEQQVFNEGLWGARTDYMGFTPEVDERWDKLLQVGIIRLPEREVKKIGISTARDKEKDGYYVYAIEMWHELHCLSILRKAISFTQPESKVHVLPNTTTRHIEHCIDNLRQIIMCRGSTALSSWRINPKGEYLPYFKDPHTCKNYAALEDWANVHRAGNWTPEREISESEMRAWGWANGVYMGHTATTPNTTDDATRN